MHYPLRRHPLPIVAHFEHCLVLTYAFPAELLRTLLPPGLEIDSVDDDGSTGLLAVAMVQTHRLRPAALPACVGRDFFLTGYRIFTRFRTPECRRLRGLRILRSDADRASMVFFGNLLTHYNYHPARVECSGSRDGLTIRVSTPRHEADLQVHADLTGTHARLPCNSCFRDERSARRFAGPLPYTFDYEPETQSIIAIRGIRRHWNPRLVSVDVGQNTFLDHPPFDQASPRLVSAFYVHDVPYRWEKGTRYSLPEAV